MRLPQLSLRKIIIALVIDWCVLSTAQAHTVRQRAMTAREIARKTFPSVVVLVAEDENGQAVSKGSGFFVRGDVIATNHHVIESVSRLHAKIIEQESSYEIKAIEGVDKENDLALLKIESTGTRPLLLGDSNRVAVGDVVYVAGNPVGLEGTFSQGIVSGIRQITGKHYIQITAPISRGSSGSPVLNNRGEVIGVAVGIIEDGQNLNFAIPVSYLASLMKEDAQPKVVKGGAPASGLVSGFESRAITSGDVNVEGSGDIETFKEEAHVHPDSAEAHFKLGEAYFKLDRYDEAIEALKQAISIKPDYVEAHFGIGLAYARLGRYDEAIEPLKEVTHLLPDDPIAHLVLGITYSELDRYGDAVEAFKQVVRLLPGDPGAPFLLASAYFELRRYDEAKGAFTQAIRIKPDFAEAHYGLSQVYLELGDKASALTEYKILKGINEDLAGKLFDEIYK